MFWVLVLESWFIFPVNQPNQIHSTLTSVTEANISVGRQTSWHPGHTLSGSDPMLHHHGTETERLSLDQDATGAVTPTVSRSIVEGSHRYYTSVSYFGRRSFLNIWLHQIQWFYLWFYLWLYSVGTFEYIWMGQKRGLQRRDKKNGLRWPRWGCYDGCAEWHAKTRSGMNTFEEQQEWRRLPKRSPRKDWSGTGMWWGEMANTYWGKCWGQIYQGKGREDDRKQDGKTRVNEIWKVLDWVGRGDGQGDVEKEDHQSYRRPYMMGKARGKEEDSVGTFEVAIIHCHANIWHADHSLPWRCLPCRSLTTVGSFNTVDIIHLCWDQSLMLGSFPSVDIIYCHVNHLLL